MSGEPTGSSGPPEPLRHRPAVRRILSLLFVVNFGSVGVYLMPDGEVDAGLLPAPVEDAAGAVLPPVKRAAFPLARRWLDATATRQHWTLFAPSPSSWEAELVAVAWYPVRAAGGAAGAAASGGATTTPAGGEAPAGAWPGASGPERAVAVAADGTRVTWEPDTLDLVQATTDPYPHWVEHRRHRIAFNMGYERWGDVYRPIYARWLCRTRRDGEARAPDGVQLSVVWRRMALPWEPPPADSVHHQPLGGWTCHALLGEEAPSYFVGEGGR